LAHNTVSKNANLQIQFPPLYTDRILLKILREIARIWKILMHILMYLDINLDVEKIEKIVKIVCCGENVHYDGTHQHRRVVLARQGAQLVNGNYSES
ncbi:hypothetical protein T310_6566, partial [Rasamsonia emersonii CBS 393.64]